MFIYISKSFRVHWQYIREQYWIEFFFYLFRCPEDDFNGEYLKIICVLWQLYGSVFVEYYNNTMIFHIFLGNIPLFDITTSIKT